MQPVSDASKPLLTIVVPVFNEEQGIGPFYQELRKATARLSYRFEYIFVDDGSADTTPRLLAEIARDEKDVQILEFSRNFGKEIALTAGLHAAKGDAVITMDSDLQHPLELLPEFVKKWEAGDEVVIGVRKKYGHEPVGKRFTSWLFYKLLGTMSDRPIIPHSTDYRLLDRQVVDAFNRFSERNRMTRGLIDWLGFKRGYIYFTSADRMYGQATYGYKKLVNLAIDSVVGLSLFPLRLAGRLGIVITSLAGLAGLFMFIEGILLPDPLGLNFSGPAMLAVLNMFWIGIILIALGLVALYIASIHSEVINRPLYVVRAHSRRPAAPSTPDAAYPAGRVKEH